MTAPVAMAFTVPGQPTPKARARVSLRGGKPRAHTPEKTVRYESTVALCAAAARPRNWPMRARYALTVRALRDAARGDLDNIVKAIKDACNGVTWSDDARVYELAARMSDGCNHPRVEVSIEARPVQCKNARCGHAQTLYPDDDDRCEACAAKARAR